jgi:putative ABC transport system permease protein
LTSNRGVTVVAIMCLALGIGVNATIFSVVDGVLIQPFPYAEPDRLVILNEANPGIGVDEALVSFPNLLDWRAAATVFDDLAAMQGRNLAISDQGEPDRYAGAATNWNLFPLLGARPAHGRLFGPEDDRFGAEPVVLLSDAVWAGRYLSDPLIVGRSILVNGRPHTVVGVMPPGFEFPAQQKLWIPLEPVIDRTDRAQRNLLVFGRLRRDATLERARQEMVSVAARLAAAQPDVARGWTAIVRPLRDEWIPDDVRLVILAMMGAVTLVLLIACTNVANLLLARATARHREMAIRTAIGASRWQIVRQLLTESVILALLSAPFGIALARVGVVLLDRAMPPDEVPYYIHWAVDWRVVAYTMGIAVLTGVVFGLAPALQTARSNLNASLKEGRGAGVGGRRARLRHALVIVEVALALVVLIGAALFVRSFVNLQSASAGFDTRPLMTVRVFLAGEAYAAEDVKTRRIDDIVRRIEGLAGVTAAFASNLVPLDGGGSGGRAIVDGRALPKGEEPLISIPGVTSHFFRTLGVPILRGRDFEDREGVTRTPVAIVNQTMARELWPGEDPIGRRFRLTDPARPDWFTVIGLVADFRHDELDDDEPQAPAAYVPYPYGEAANTGLTIRVASGDPALVIAPVRAQIRASDPGVPVFSIQTMEHLRQLGFWQYELFGWMFGTFGLVALLLAAIGVYGVLSYSVTQQTQEIGVRVALGADRGAVIRMVVGRGVRLALAGIGLGLLGAFGVTRVVQSLLYNVTPTDPLSFIAVGAFLVGVAILASYVPARRATRVDPLTALRTE